MKRTVTTALDNRRRENPATNIQGVEKPEIGHSKAEAESTTSKLTVALEGPPAVEVSNRLFGGPKIEHIDDLASDPKKGLREEEFREVNAEKLKENIGEETSLNYLSVLGRERVIVKGWSHIIAGYPKAGKTELMARTIAEWEDEKILYFTEEAESLWRTRVLTLPECYRLNHVRLCFALGASPEAVLKRIRIGSESVVVIDTIRSFLGFEDETDNTEVNRALTPFVKAARDAGKTILFIHHMRKAPGKHGHGITGAHAFLGTVDIGIELKQEKNNRRQISGQGRVIEIEEFLYEKLDDGTFTALGAAKDVSFDVVKKRVMEALGDKWKTTNEVRIGLENPKPGKDHLTNALNALAGEKAIKRNPPISEGKRRGVTYQWRLLKKKAEKPITKVAKKEGRK